MNALRRMSFGGLAGLVLITAVAAQAQVAAEARDPAFTPSGRASSAGPAPRFADPSHLPATGRTLNSSDAKPSAPQLDGGAIHAFATEAVMGQYTALYLDTPGTIHVFNLFADLAFAGDFGMDGLMYVMNYTTGNLESLTRAGQRTVIAPSAPQGNQVWAGLAVHPLTGVMFASATECTVNSTLYTLDLTTGTPTVVGPVTNSPCLIALAIDDTGAAFGYDIHNDELISVDLATGAGTVIGSIGFNANFAQGMDYDSTSGQFYMSAFNGTTLTSELRTVNTTTGATTLVGQMGSELLEFGWMAIDNDRAGCTFLDADTDEVGDSCDLCPDTIAGVTVGDDGCPDPAIPGDCDHDGDVDGNDINAFILCASGPDIPFVPGCEDKDFDNDGDVDTSDFSLIQRCHLGVNIPGDPSCAN